MLNKIILIVSLFLIFSLIGTIFWNQELKYQLPTPVPENYLPIEIGEKISLDEQFSLSEDKPILIHFFNPDCPCSKFNIKHFNALLHKYKNKIDFYVVVKSDDESTDVSEFKNKFPQNVIILNDMDNKIAKNCGVYATPQAVVINKDKVLFYRGNYNKSRYCTLRESSYADIAIDSMLAGKKSPVFDNLAYVAYGCEIPKK